MGYNPLTVGGDFANSGTYTVSSNQETIFTATSSGHTINNGTGNLYHMIVDGAGAYSFSDASNTLDGDLTIKAGTLTASTNMTVVGSFTNQGTFTHNSGTLTLTSASPMTTIDPGASSLNNVTFNNASGTWSLSGDMTLAGDLTMTAGTLTGSGNLTVNGGDITGNGSIVMTGSNTYLYGLKQISAGNYFTCAISNSGKTYCWGEANFGQLGDNQSTTNRTTPILVEDGAATGPDTDGTYLINIKQIATGNYHTCALSNSGKTYCWGSSSLGALGDNQSSTDRTTPVLVQDGVATGSDTDGTYLTNIKQLTAGYANTCALSNSGKTYCWGWATNGKLGDNQSTTARTTPVLVHDGAATGSDTDGTYLINIKQISTGQYRTCALSNSGKTYCWGYAANGALGDNQTTTDRTTPVLVEDGAATGSDTDGTYLTNIKQISTESNHTCALSHSGKTYCWGGAGNGQLGDNQISTDRTTPVLVEDGAATGADTDGTYLINIKQISTGSYHTCAVSNSGKTYCWGDAANGKLGDAQSTTDRTTPVLVQDGSATGPDTDGTYLINIKQMTAGWYHTCAVSNSGKTYCWGTAQFGRLGDAQSSTDRTTPVFPQDGATTHNPATLIDTTGSFGGNTAWSFYSLTFGDGTGTTTSTASGTGGITADNILTIAANQTFDAQAKTLTLAGSGTPFVISGTFTPSTSTMNYIGSAATTLKGTTYNNLGVGTTSDTTSAVTYTLGADTTVGGVLTVGNSGSTNTDILNGSSYTLDLKGDSIATPFIITSKGSYAASTSTVNYTASNDGNINITAATYNILGLGTTSDTSQGAVYALAGNITANGGLTIGNTGSTNNDQLNQGAYTMTVGAVTVTSHGIWSNLSTGDIVLGGNVANAGSIILNSNNGSACVDGTNDIVITSSVGATQRTWSGAGSYTLRNLSVTDMLGALPAENSTFSNSNWTLTFCGITISGTVYSDEGSTTMTGTPAVRVKVNGAGSYTANAASGVYSIPSVTIGSAGDVITVYLDTAGGNKAVAVTRAANTSSNISTFNLYQNRVILRHEDSGPITNANLNQYDSTCNSGTGDTDIPFCVDQGNLSLSTGTKLIVWTGKTFTPGGSVTTYPSSNSANPDGDIDIQSSATLSMGLNPLSVGGDFTNTGILTLTSGQETNFTAISSGHVIDNGTGNLKNVLFEGSGAYSFSDATNTIDEDLIIKAGTLTASTNMTIVGSFKNQGTFTHNSGTLTLTSASSMTSIDPGASTLNNVTFNNASGTWSLSGDMTLAGDLTMTAGTLTGSGNLTVNGGDITGNGSIVMTGSNTYLYGLRQTATEGYHTCALSNSGKAYCWGKAINGQLGDNQTTTDRTTPVLVEDGVATTPDSDGTYLINIKQIAAGYNHTCALSNSGKTYCWGAASSGQLGDNQTSTQRNTPVLVEDGAATGSDTDGTYLINIKQISLGQYRTCALSNSGKTYCWGSASEGELGDNGTTQRTTPVLVEDGAATGSDTDGTYLINIKQITTGYYHTCAVSNSGKTYCWGASWNGQLGDNQTSTQRNTPVLVEDGAATGSDTDGTYLINTKQISAGEEHTCALSNSGKAYCWGYAAHGRVGDNQSSTNRTTPVFVEDGAATGADTDGTYLINIKQVSAGGQYTCAISNSGQTYCWGRASFGELGDNQISTNRLTPVLVEDGTATGSDTDGNYLINIKQIVTGYYHTCALSNSGKTYCWGAAGNGQLGDNQISTSRLTPVLTEGGATTHNPATLLDTTGSFGGNTAWSFYSLTFGDGTGTTTSTASGTGGITADGVLTIAASQTFNAASKTITLAGAGTPFVVTGTFTPATSTLNYIGSSATTLAGTTYNNMGVGTTSDTGAAVTYTFGGSPTIGGVLTIGNASSTNTDILDGSSRTIDLTSSGTPFVVTSKGSFTASTSTVKYNGQSATNVTAATYNILKIGTTNDTSAGVTYTLAGNITANGGLTIGDALSTNNDTLSQGTYTMTIGAVTVTSHGIWSNISTGDIVLSGDVSNAGSIILNSNNGSACVDGTNDIVITSSVGATQRTWSGAGTYTLRNLSVTDMLGALSAENSSFSNSNWTLYNCGITISGTVYSDEGTTTMTGTPAVRIKVNGAGSYTANAASGVYSIPSVVIGTAGDVITVYLDTNGGNKAVTVTRAANTSSNITSLNLYQDRVIVRHEDAGPITNLNLDQYDSVNDTDIPFNVVTVTGGLTVSSGTKLIVWTGKTFTPGYAVTTTASSTQANPDGDLTIQSSATLSMGSNALSVGGDFLNSSTYSYSAGQVITFTATGTGFMVDDGASNFSVATFNGSGGSWTLGSNLDLQGASTTSLAITAGTLNTGGFTLTGAGATDTLSVSNGATFIMSGTSAYPASFTTYTYGATSNVKYNQSTATTITNATYGNLELAPSANTITFTLPATVTDIPGTLTIGNGTNTAAVITGATNNPSFAVAGNMTVAANTTYTTGSGTLTLSGSSTPLTVTGTFSTSGGNTVNYTGSSATSVAGLTYVNLGAGTTSDAGTAVTYTLGGDTNVTGVLTIGNSGSTNTDILDGSSRTLDLQGTGTPFVITTKGSFTASTSTINYNGQSATNIASATYNNLGVGTSSDASTGVSYSLMNNTSVNGVLTVGNASSTNTDNLIPGTYAINLGGSGTPFVVTSKGSFSAGSSAVDYVYTAISPSGVTVAPLTYYDLGVGRSTDSNIAVTYTLGGNTTVTNTLTIGSASSTNTDILSGSNRTLTLSGTGTVFNPTSKGTYSAGTSTVLFSGSSAQTVAGSSTFYNLQATAAATRTLSFTAGTTQSIASGGSVTFTGASGQLLTLASTTPGTEWNLQANTGIASQSIQYVSVSDCNAGPFGTYTEMSASDGTSTDGGNNTNWDFGTKANGFLTYF